MYIYFLYYMHIYIYNYIFICIYSYAMVCCIFLYCLVIFSFCRPVFSWKISTFHQGSTDSSATATIRTQKKTCTVRKSTKPTCVAVPGSWDPVDGWNPVNSPVEVGSLSHYLRRVSYIPVVQDFSHQQYCQAKLHAPFFREIPSKLPYNCNVWSPPNG